MRMPLRLVFGILILTLLTGCPAHLQEQEGDAFAARGQWNEAATAYRRARDIVPDDEVVREKLAHARRQAAKGEMVKAEKAIQRNRLQAAWAHLETAARLTPEDPRIAQLRDRIRGATALRIRGSIATAPADGAVSTRSIAVRAPGTEGEADDPYAAAYADLEMLQEHDPGHPLLGTLSQELAAAAFAEAKALTKADRYFEARARLRLLRRYQPGQEKKLDREVSMVEQEWVVFLRVRAKKDTAKKRYASAFVHRSIGRGTNTPASPSRCRSRAAKVLLADHGDAALGPVQPSQRVSDGRQSAISRSAASPSSLMFLSLSSSCARKKQA